MTYFFTHFVANCLSKVLLVDLLVHFKSCLCNDEVRLAVAEVFWLPQSVHVVSQVFPVLLLLYQLCNHRAAQQLWKFDSRWDHLSKAITELDGFKELTYSFLIASYRYWWKPASTSSCGSNFSKRSFISLTRIILVFLVGSLSYSKNAWVSN